jgi:predicted GNAT family N-acyltransferase
MKKMVSLKWQDTIAIRQTVLWPNQPAEFCHVNGDETAIHYGVTINDQLVAVASINLDKGSDGKQRARLRKFATLQSYQSQGVGTFLLKNIMQQLQSQGISSLWCDAREEAIGFYQRLGLQAHGERFYNVDVAYFKMEVVFNH